MVKRTLVMVLVGVLGLAACGDDSSDPSAGGGEAAPTAGEELFADPLDDDSEGWGVVSVPEGRSFYEEGDLVWENRDQNVTPHFSPDTLIAPVNAGDLDLADVLVRAEGRVTSGDASIGVFCRDGEDADGDAEGEWYEFLARDGYAAIRRTDSERNIEVLAEGDDVALTNGDAVAIEAGCVNQGEDEARLTLAVDGELVLDTVVDDPLPNGAPGLLMYDVPTAEDLTTVRWAEFTVHRPAS